MQTEAQKRAELAQIQRWKDKGIIKVTLRVHQKDKQKFLKLAKKSRASVAK